MVFENETSGFGYMCVCVCMWCTSDGIVVINKDFLEKSSLAGTRTIEGGRFLQFSSNFLSETEKEHRLKA